MRARGLFTGERPILGGNQTSSNLSGVPPFGSDRGLPSNRKPPIYHLKHIPSADTRPSLSSSIKFHKQTILGETITIFHQTYLSALSYRWKMRLINNESAQELIALVNLLKPQFAERKSLNTSHGSHGLKTKRIINIPRFHCIHTIITNHAWKL